MPEEIDLNFNLPQPPSSVDSTTGRVSCFGRMWAAIGRVLRSTVELFRGPTLRPTLVLSGIWALLSFGFYGLTLWMPNYFQHGGIDTHTSVYEVSGAENVWSETPDSPAFSRSLRSPSMWRCPTSRATSSPTLPRTGWGGV